VTNFIIFSRRSLGRTEENHKKLNEGRLAGVVVRAENAVYSYLNWLKFKTPYFSLC
jgi:hypothetical protein